MNKKNKFFTSIRFNVHSKLYEKSRLKHLEFVKNNHKQIKYGGVLYKNEKKSGIIYIVMAKNLEEATNFVKKDPYFDIATSYEVYKFEQKLPIEQNE